MTALRYISWTCIIFGVSFLIVAYVAYMRQKLD